MSTIVWSWVSFAVGFVACPIIFVGGTVAYDAVVSGIHGYRMKRYWAVSCDHCARERGEHGGRALQCPKPTRYEEDEGLCFKSTAQGMAERAAKSKGGASGG